MIALSESLWVKGQRIKYETCENTFLRPKPTPDPEHNCMPREMLVKLDLPDDYFHVAPDHVTVKRCGGSCHFDR